MAYKLVENMFIRKGIGLLQNYDRAISYKYSFI